MTSTAPIREDSQALDSGQPSAAQKPSFSTEQAVGQIAETAWGPRDAPISYGFRTSGGDVGFTRLTAAHITAAEQALQLWADVADLRFERVGRGASGDDAYRNDASMLFAGLTNSSSVAYAYLPGSRDAGARAGDAYSTSATRRCATWAPAATAS